MKSIFAAAATLVLSISAVGAQSMNKENDPKQQSPGSTGAMQNAPANGVATDPQQVQAQQGSNSKASPGTVGAAPAADTKSQQPGK